MRFLKAQRLFFLPYIFFLLIAVALIISYDQKELHLFLNGFHTSFFDGFFYWVTYLGDGRLLLLIPLLLIVSSARKVIYIFISTALASIFTQILKRIIEAPRPSKVFEEGQLYIVEGMNLHKHFSFPSGHTTTAFAFFFCLSILKPKYSWLFLLIAVLSGFSRIYLSQHFLEDVVAGSLIGISGGFIGLLVMRLFRSPKLDRNLFGLENRI